MKKAIIVLAVLAFMAFAGDMTTGGAELTKFKGYGTFRWTSFGAEGADPANQFSDYVYMAWLPKINDNVDFCVSFSHTTTSSDVVDFYTMYLNLNLTESLSLRGGQFKKPFGYGYTRSGGSMYFADRTMIVAGPNSATSDFGLYGGIDIGAMLTAEFAPVTVDLMFSNGTGKGTMANDTVNKQFTARLAVEPTEWLTIGGSVAMIGSPDDDDTEGVDESWGSNGMDFFAVANYPVSPTGTFCFTGEYMMLGYNGNDVENMEMHDGTGMSVMAGYMAELDGNVLVNIMPAVRYDMVDPIKDWAASADEPEDNMTFIDFCVNMGLFSEMNTLQIGARNYAYEADVDGATDIYANWRINF